MLCVTANPPTQHHHREDSPQQIITGLLSQYLLLKALPVESRLAEAVRRERSKATRL